MSTEGAFLAYKYFLENCTLEDVNQLGNYVSRDVSFRDPFHNTTGIKQMENILALLFKQVQDIRFSIFDHVIYQSSAYYRWRLTGLIVKKAWEVEGVTHLEFDEKNKIIQHIEYWDAASQFYEHLPIIGPILRTIRKRIMGNVETNL